MNILYHSFERSTPINYNDYKWNFVRSVLMNNKCVHAAKQHTRYLSLLTHVKQMKIMIFMTFHSVSKCSDTKSCPAHGKLSSHTCK